MVASNSPVNNLNEDSRYTVYGLLLRKGICFSLLVVKNWCLGGGGLGSLFHSVTALIAKKCGYLEKKKNLYIMFVRFSFNSVSTLEKLNAEGEKARKILVSNDLVGFQ